MPSVNNWQLKTKHFYKYEPRHDMGNGGNCEDYLSAEVCNYYWIGVVLEAPEDSNYPIFRCTDYTNSHITPGCENVCLNMAQANSFAYSSAADIKNFEFSPSTGTCPLAPV